MQRIIQKRAISVPGAVAARPMGDVANSLTRNQKPTDFITGFNGQEQVPWPQEWSSGYFGPGQPVSPTQTQESEPRIFQYMPGHNLIYVPRSGFNLMDFSQLRGIADVSKEVRLCIELIKKEIRGFDWHIVPDDLDDIAKYKDDIKKITSFWNRPDRELYFDQWINTAIEDVMAIDALAISRNKTKDGTKLAQLEIIDGATIKPLLDIRGKTPQPPFPAYTQVLYGTPWVFLTKNQIIYEKFNTSSRHPYGRSPIENIVYFVNMAVRRDLFNMNYFTSGNIPEGLAGAPKEWSVDQIKAFQTYWDALLKGDPENARTLRFVPSDMVKVYEFRRPNFESGWEEWLLRVSAWAFGISPIEFGITGGGGLGDAAFTEGQANTHFRMGPGPIMRYLKSIISHIIEDDMKMPHLHFEWVAEDPTPDKMAEAQVASTYLQNGVWSIDEVRAKNGDKPLGIPHFLLVGGQPILLEDLIAGKLNMNPGGEGPTNIQGAVGEDGTVASKEKDEGTSEGLKSEDVAVAPENKKPITPEEKKVAELAAKTSINGDIKKQLVALDLDKFEKKVISRIKKGKPGLASFESEFIDSDTMAYLNSVLPNASVKDTRTIFTEIKKIIGSDDSNPGDDVEGDKTNVVRKIEINGKTWFWKPAKGESQKMQDWIGHSLFIGELAYYKTAQLMGIEDVVPETVYDKIDGEEGVRLLDIGGSDQEEKPNMYSLDPVVIEKIGLLDLISAQQDRATRNYIRKGNKAYTIDNALCYSMYHGLTSKRFWGNSAFSAAIGGHTISDWAKEAIVKFLDEIKDNNTEFSKAIGEMLETAAIVYAINRARLLSNSTEYPTAVLNNLR